MKNKFMYLCEKRQSDIQRNILKPEISAFKSFRAFSSVMLLHHVVPFESRPWKIDKKAVSFEIMYEVEKFFFNFAWDLLKPVKSPISKILEIKLWCFSRELQ